MKVNTKFCCEEEDYAVKSGKSCCLAKRKSINVG